MKRQFSSGIALTDPNAPAPMFKRTLICKTGSWLGSDGEVEVTKELLQSLADRYNEERASAINKNDYAPILVDHDRKVNNVLGRLDISRVKLSVEPLADNGYGLFGELRIDEDYAKFLVDSGKYAQVSLSFDDETFEIYEVSFVAVEAARRSQILSRGDKKMKKKNNVVALSMVNGIVSKNREVKLGIVNGVKSTNTNIKSLKAQIAEVQSGLRTAGLKSLFMGLIREGKMTKAEVTKLNLKELSALNPTALSAITDSYKNRKPSTDMFQFGKEGAKPAHNELSSADFRKLRDQQLGKGKKGSRNLESGDDQEDEDKNKGQQNDMSADDDSSESLAMEDVKGIEDLISKCLEGVKSLTESIDSIQSYAKKLQVDDKKEEDLASGDDDSNEDDDKDSEDLSSGDEDDNEDDEENK